MNKKIVSIIIMIGVWQLLAFVAGREVIMPTPLHVFERVYHLLLSSNFYSTVFTTLFRANLSFLLALIFGIVFGLMAAFHSSIESFLSPILTFFQTIPQISYMIVLLVWFDQFMCIMIIILLMTFPVVYHNVLNGIKNIDSNLIDIIRQHYHPMPYLIRHVYLPLIKPYILTAIDTILPLSLKIGVMAEVLIQANKGIGAKLYYARMNIDMIGVFAWTICLVAILLLEIKIVNLAIFRNENRLERPKLYPVKWTIKK